MNSSSTDTPWRLPLWIGAALLVWFVLNGQTGGCRAVVEQLTSLTGG